MKAVAEQVQKHKVAALVVDPVLVATSGDSLAASEVVQALKAHLFPLATVITPNLPEASALLGGRRVDDLASMKEVGASMTCGHLSAPYQAVCTLAMPAAEQAETTCAPESPVGHVWDMTHMKSPFIPFQFLIPNASPCLHPLDPPPPPPIYLQSLPQPPLSVGP